MENGGCNPPLPVGRNPSQVTRPLISHVLVSHIHPDDNDDLRSVDDLIYQLQAECSNRRAVAVASGASRDIMSMPPHWEWRHVAAISSEPAAPPHGHP